MGPDSYECIDITATLDSCEYLEILFGTLD